MRATFTFEGILNDFLPHSCRDITFNLDFAPHQSLKHLIESLGVPHTDFGRLVVNGQEADSSSLLREGDAIVVYPADAQLDEDCFVLDNHLGQLATYLRMLGFDSLYRNDYQDEELTEIATQERRTLLTRDRRLLMRKAISDGYCLHSTDPRQQVREVIQRFRLANLIKPFQRCLRCNHSLQQVNKEEIIDRLEPLTKLYFDEFHICPNCMQVYWKGSHYGHMLELIKEMENLETPSHSQGARMEPSLITFPSNFPIKVMGANQDDFEALVRSIIEKHAVIAAEDGVITRLSRGGKYLSVTVHILAESQEQLDNIYRELSAHERVLMAL